MARVTLHFPAPVLFTHPLQLRISDINHGHHLGHDTLVSLFHDSRCQWLASHNMAEWDIDGLATVVAELVVNYRAEAFVNDTLQMELALGDIGNKSAEIYQQLRKGEKVIAVAKVSLVFFDIAARQSAPVPQAFLKLVRAEH